MEIKDKELHHIAATCIIHKDGKFLIIKRAPHKMVMPSKWAVPGGGMKITDYINEPVSTKGSDQWYGVLERVVRREVREEVNVEIGKTEYLTDLTFIRPDNVPVLCLSFYAPYLSGEVKLDEDATEYAWITAAEVGEYDLIDGVDHEILQVDAILKKRGV